MLDLLGEADRHLRQVESLFRRCDSSRGDEVALKGPDTEVERARTVLEELLILVQEGHALDSARVDEVVKMVIEDVPSPSGVLSDGIPGARADDPPEDPRPAEVHGSHQENTLTFGIGPAGTGKTYLAMAAAVDSLVSGSVRRIILTRPAVEAGERPDSSRETSPPRSIPTYGLCMTPCGTCSAPRRRQRWSRREPSR